MADATYTVALRDNSVSSGFAKISTQITRSDKSLGKFRRGLNKLGGATGRLAFRGITAGAFAFTRVLRGAIDKFVQFDKGLRSANTLMRLTEQELQEVGRGVEQFAVEFGQPAEDLLGALKLFKSASFDAKTSLELVGAAGKLAQAGFIKTEEAVGGLIAGIKIFGVSQEQLSNQIAATVEKGVLTFGKVGRFLQLTGLFAKQANLDLSETLTIIEKLTEPGVPANIAITQARAFLIDITTERTQKRFRRELGPGVQSDIRKVGLQGIVDVLKFAEEQEVGTIARIFINKKSKAAALGLINATNNSVRSLIAFNRAAEVGTFFLDKQLAASEGAFLEFQRSQESINISLRKISSQLTTTFSGAIESLTKKLQENAVSIETAGKVIADVAGFLIDNVPKAVGFVANTAKEVLISRLKLFGQGDLARQLELEVLIDLAAGRGQEEVVKSLRNLQVFQKEGKFAHILEDKETLLGFVKSDIQLRKAEREEKRFEMEERAEQQRERQLQQGQETKNAMKR